MDIQGMSTNHMERAILEILCDSGMNDELAENTVKAMSTKDMENYLLSDDEADI